LKQEELDGLVALFFSSENMRDFSLKKESNFAYTHKDGSRFRGNAFLGMGRTSIALRLVPARIKTLAELNLPDILESFAKRQQGFFIVVGPAGQGKSTTLATMVESINQDRLEHIITIEDPIEFVFTPQKSLIDQREVKTDTPDFHTALWGSFRQDADVIMIGEMREPDTISAAVTAAETGHLVLSTLHTNTAAQTVDRIIDAFQADQQDQIRTQLSLSLIGIFSQRLVPRISGGLIPAYELLINNSAVSNLIREGRTHEINEVIETGSAEGMIDLNRMLSELVRSGEITVENARAFASNLQSLDRMV
ncbi:MAG: twitching motility protein twitching motility protein PilT, partial [Parcubacteria group bacterium]|nr:twitching motility protein twitching motility protein PilT [Parcubacteria group bacterium]